MREVSQEEINMFIERYPEVLETMETSAKEDTNIAKAFLSLATELKHRHSSDLHPSLDKGPTVNMFASKSIKTLSCCNS